MSITIENLTDYSVFLRFNSGRTQHLAPHEMLADVATTEIKSNAKIEKLVERRVLAIVRQEESQDVSPSQPRKRETKKSGTH